MDRLEAMSVLLAVVDTGSLSAASRKLGTPLATVSRKISDLETHLRTRLLTRSSRRVALTDAGRSYVAACRRILEDVVEAERAASGEYRAPIGNLVITAPIVFGRLHVLPVVAEFLKAYPEIDVRLILVDRFVNLLEGGIDVALRLGELPDSSLVATRLGSIRRVVCASPAYLSANGTPMHPDDLGKHKCITFDGRPPAWSLRVGKVDRSFAIRSRLVVNTAEAMVDAAAAGLGITRVRHYQMVAAHRAGLLDIVLGEFEPEPATVNFVYDGRGVLPLKTRTFLDFAAPRLKAAIRAIAE